MLKRSWIEIDLNQLRENYRIYREMMQNGQQIMAVVKADAYGHGEKEVATVFFEEGCQNFAVSNIEEGISLRKAGIKGQILILGYTPIQNAKELVLFDLTQAILSEEYAEKLPNLGIKAHFAIDTGMNRIGLDADDPEKCEEIIRKYTKKFTLTGIFTHLCVADTITEEEFTTSQLEKFKEVVNRIADLKLPNIHCMNSAGFLSEKPYGNMARLGIVLYGLRPDYSMKLPKGVKPALKWKSVISQIKTVKSGETIGYGRTYLAEKEMQVATIPTGYADGYNRLLSNKGIVFIHGKQAPIVGRICMDQMVVDVSDIPSAKFEDEVILLDEKYTADEMALLTNSIGYEIICDIGKRVTRSYKNE